MAVAISTPIVASSACVRPHLPISSFVYCIGQPPVKARAMLLSMPPHFGPISSTNLDVIISRPSVGRDGGLMRRAVFTLPLR
jgi:hypothetical protein